MLFGFVALMKTLTLKGMTRERIEVRAMADHASLRDSAAYVLAEVRQGDGSVLRNGIRCAASAPCFWVSPLSEIWSFTGSDTWKLHVLVIDGRVLETVCPGMPGDRALEVWRRLASGTHVWTDPELCEKLHALSEAWEVLRGREDGDIAALSLLWQMTALLQAPATEDLALRAPLPPRRLIAAVQYMQDNFSTKVLLADLARTANMSVSNFSAVFHRMYGMPPMEYLLQLRLQHATYLLRHTDEKIITVSEECGFFSNSNFVRAFTLAFGVSPSEYRKKCRVAADASREKGEESVRGRLQAE